MFSPSWHPNSFCTRKLSEAAYAPVLTAREHRPPGADSRRNGALRAEHQQAAVDRRRAPPRTSSRSTSPLLHRGRSKLAGRKHATIPERFSGSPRARAASAAVGDFSVVVAKRERSRSAREMTSLSAGGISPSPINSPLTVTRRCDARPAIAILLAPHVGDPTRACTAPTRLPVSTTSRFLSPIGSICSHADDNDHEKTALDTESRQNTIEVADPARPQVGSQSPLYGRSGSSLSARRAESRDRG
jgi:hypothetical protein